MAKRVILDAVEGEPGATGEHHDESAVRRVIGATPLRAASHDDTDEADPTLAANLWVERMLIAGLVVVVPEIMDCEIRRELIRAREEVGLRRLDALGPRAPGIGHDVSRRVVGRVDQR